MQQKYKHKGADMKKSNYAKYLLVGQLLTANLSQIYLFGKIKKAFPNNTEAIKKDIGIFEKQADRVIKI